MNTEEAAATFIAGVRELYEAVFGNAQLGDLPYSLGSVLVLLAVDHIAGDSGSVTIYGGNKRECKGLAWEFLLDTGD